MFFKQYHFFVRENFCGGWLVLERGRENHFSLCYPTKYRAQLIAGILRKLWENNDQFLLVLKNLLSHPEYEHDWSKCMNMLLAYKLV